MGEMCVSIRNKKLGPNCFSFHRYESSCARWLCEKEISFRCWICLLLLLLVGCAIPFHQTSDGNGTLRNTETFLNSTLCLLVETVFAFFPFSFPIFPFEFLTFPTVNFGQPMSGRETFVFLFYLPFWNENCRSQLCDGVEMSRTCSSYSFPLDLRQFCVRLLRRSLSDEMSAGFSRRSDCNRVNDAKGNWQLKYLPLWNSLALV